jgi:hypothetical protein
MFQVLLPSARLPTLIDSILLGLAPTKVRRSKLVWLFYLASVIRHAGKRQFGWIKECVAFLTDRTYCSDKPSKAGLRKDLPAAAQSSFEV